MALVHESRDEFRADVYAACRSGDTRRVEKLMVSTFKDGATREMAPTKWDFQDNTDVKGLMGQSPLHLAAEKGHVEIVRLLVQRVAVDVDLTDGAGWTALHWGCAIRSNGTEDAADSVAKILLDAGAQPGATADNTQDSPMHFAAANGHLGVVTMLVERGADVTRTNSEGGTPVHVAAQRGHTDIVKYLSAHGGDLNQPNSTGNTPVHLAAAANRLDVVEELVALAPDCVNVANIAGKLPSDVAGCEAGRDMVKPFKRAVNTVRAALKFNDVAGLAMTGARLSGKSPVPSKFTRTPRSSDIATPDVSKLNLGAPKSEAIGE